MTAEFLQPVWLSLKIAIISSVLVFCGGLVLAKVMAGEKRFPGKDLIEGLVTLPLVLPPTVIGFGLLLLLGKDGPVGIVLDKLFDVQVIFSWWAGVIAAVITSFPLMYRSARGALEAINQNLLRAARTLGAGEFKIFLTVSIPLAWPGILAGLILAFTRAMGEFGATLMIAGNIPGRTQTIPMAIFSAVESGDRQTALLLVGIVTTLAFIVLYGLNRWSSSKAVRY